MWWISVRNCYNIDLGTRDLRNCFEDAKDLRNLHITKYKALATHFGPGRLPIAERFERRLDLRELAA